MRMAGAAQTDKWSANIALIQANYQRNLRPQTNLCLRFRRSGCRASCSGSKTRATFDAISSFNERLVWSEHVLCLVAPTGDIFGLTVGFLVGGRIPDRLQDDRIKYDLIAGKRLFERNVEKLLLGRIDAVYAPLSTALVEILDEMDVADQVKLVPIEFLDLVQIYTVFSKKTVRENVVESYNNALDLASRERKYLDYIKIYKSRSSAK